MAAVQVVPTHVVGACDGQAAASDEFHYPPQLGFPVSKKLGGEEEISQIIWLSPTPQEQILP